MGNVLDSLTTLLEAIEDSRPKLIDFYCGGGGASVGYAQAGFHVVGVDHLPQKNYPYDFIQADCLDVLRYFDLSRFDAIHASPPCKVHTKLWTVADDRHTDLLTPTRPLLERTGLPWVIENVPGAPMRSDLFLCGTHFHLGANCRDGKFRHLQRHRWFETNWPVVPSPHTCFHFGPAIGVYGHGGISRSGNYMGHIEEWREAMEIPWMVRHDLAEAIPPAYTKFVGRQMKIWLK